MVNEKNMVMIIYGKWEKNMVMIICDVEYGMLIKIFDDGSK